MGQEGYYSMYKMKKVLVACEESQVVCIAFRNLGYEAYSCDVQECSGNHPEWHIKGDVLDIINDGWDLLIGHPPCTYLSYAGTARWNQEGRLEKRLEALNFFSKLWLAPISKICLENPAGCASPTIAKYSQIIQPYYFGDAESKRTWLWLKGLPALEPTDIVKPKIYAYSKKGKPVYRTAYMRFSNNRAVIRSKTFPGIARAMASQWGHLIGDL